VAIASGTRIGSYDVATLIGSGGMGEVYRAHDARLGRDVAIKVLPAAFSTDPDRLRRFEQEARAAAALNHPNILTVHEVGSFSPASDATASPYVVSELLEGQTLRDALAGGALPIRRVIDYATQIAGGLAAAHEKGVVHRDLKPENLFITRDGRVKILDFGLAKLREPDTPAEGVTTLPTRNFDTGVGVVLGTAGYMSPEQVRAQPVDHRTDIFSFGAVLYEMISGARAFRGETTADTISAILKNEPPELSALNVTVPVALERIVNHCLEKTPELRYQAARDIVFNLEMLSTTGATSTVGATAVGAPVAASKRRRLPVVAAAAAVVAASVLAGAAGMWFAGRSHDTPAFRQVTSRRGTLNTARFTADGQNIVYTAAWETSPSEVFMVPAAETGGRSLEVKDAALLAVNGNGEMAVALNPRRLTPFLTPGTLARGSMTAGAPKPQIENVLAADFTPDGSGLAIVRNLPGERRCQLEFPAGTVLYQGGALLTDVRFSRDGKHLAFIDHPVAGDDRGSVVILRSDGAKVITGHLRESHRGLAWSPDGTEVWTTAPLLNGVIEAVDLQGRYRDVLNVPGRLHLRDVRPDGRILVEQGTSRRGMVVVTNNGATERDLTWLSYSYVRDISRDGRLVLFEEQEMGRTFVRNVDGSPAVEIGAGYAVALSNDNAWALAMHFGKADPELWLEPVGPGQPRKIGIRGLTPLSAGQFFADGKRVLFVAREQNRPQRTWIVTLDGSAAKAISEEGVVAIFGGSLSPDQRWIAATSSGGPVLVPVDGGAPTPIRGASGNDNVRQWTSDGQLFVASVSPTGLRIDRLNPWTGERRPWQQATPPVFSGLTVGAPFITPDGSAYAYGYGLASSDLFVVTGVR
jgi:eukaryotic-like serine/threonine-protein kinase